MQLPTWLRGPWQHGVNQWFLRSGYQRFEYLTALCLTYLVSLIILVALFRVSVAVITSLLFGTLNPLEHGVFQEVFGQIMTLLIALEFNHTIRTMATRAQSIIQTKVVLLIALLALARKVILLDLHEIGPTVLVALAALTLALGGTYWLLREDESRPPPAP